MIPRAFRDRLSARLDVAQLTLSSGQADLLERYWQLLERWNSKINLTALPLSGYPAHSIDRLIIEPLMAASLISTDPLDWYDLGSGGGSPAVPLKVVRPAARLTMVESRSRKSAFLREVLRSLGYTATATVERARFEDVAKQHPAAADYITVRAVRPDEVLFGATLQLLRPSGRLFLFGSAADPSELPGFKLFNKIEVAQTSTVIRVAVPRGTKG